MTQEFNKDRALKLIRSERLLKKVWDKVPAKDKDTALVSVFNALIKNDKGMMALYEKTV